jgi:hypothetical protein
LSNRRLRLHYEFSARHSAGIGVFLAGCSDKQNSPSATTNAASSGGSVLTAPVDYLDAVARAKTTAEKTVDTVSLNNAIQMFRVEQGRNPTSLDELVKEKVIPRLPTAPYGMKIVYDTNSGTVKVVKQ